MPSATFVVAGDCTAPLKSTKPVHNVIVNVIVLLSFLFACSSTKIALSTTCAADESKRKTFWPQGHLQVSENKRIHVNGCPRTGVIVFFLLSFFQLKPTVYILAARLDRIISGAGLLYNPNWSRCGNQKKANHSAPSWTARRLAKMKVP